MDERNTLVDACEMVIMAHADPTPEREVLAHWAREQVIEMRERLWEKTGSNVEFGRVVSTAIARVRARDTEERHNEYLQTLEGLVNALLALEMRYGQKSECN
jgi:hypothetical protein